MRNEIEFRRKGEGEGEDECEDGNIPDVPAILPLLRLKTVREWFYGYKYK